MQSTHALRNTFFLLIMALQLAACGGGGGSSSETTPPTVISQTPTTNLIDQSQTFTFVFDESMNTGSYTLGGKLASASNGGVWSQTTVMNDTLTISPQTSWPVNTEQTLIINARDLAGNPLATQTRTLAVYRGTLYYVSPAAVDDSGDGLTPMTAKQTIMAAVNAASNPATVLVEAGTYPVIYSPVDTRVYLKEGVSLYGGFNTSFTDRSIGSSIIADQSSLTTTLPNPAFAVLGNTGITAATLLDGFTLLGAGSGSNLTAGLRLRDSAAPTVQHGTINGGSGSSASYAIFLENGAAPLIQQNTLYGGSGGTSSAGIYSGSSSPVVLNNLIEGGSGGNSSYAVISPGGGPMQIRANRIFGGSGSDFTAGISVLRGTHTIDNNLIHAGVGAQSHGVLNTEGSVSVRNNTVYGGSGIVKAVGLEFSYSDVFGSSFDIENNIIISPGLSGICIKSSWPWPPYNNDLYCPTSLYQYLATDYKGLNASGNVTVNANGIGTGLMPPGLFNVSIDPLLVDIDGPDNNINTMADNDWHLSASTPMSVKTGGLNGIDQSWMFTTDKDGVTRPASGTPWSIGAYEP